MADEGVSKSDGEFIDAESPYYSTGKDKLSFPLIVLFHFKRISELASKEWHGGYWSDKTKSSGGYSYVERSYIPDTRECFWNAINCLYDLCYPYFDDKMKKADTPIQKELNGLYDKCIVEVDEEHSASKKKVLNTPKYNKENMVLMRKLFRELGAFLKRKDYFKRKEVED